MTVRPNAREIFKDNLTRYMRARGVDQSYIVSQLGLTASTVSDWVHGKKYPRVDAMQRLADLLGVSMAELTTADAPSVTRPLPAGLSPVRKRRIPMIGHVAAGVPIMAEREYEEYEDDTYGISCDYVLRVEGDSMEPRIMDGDVVYVREQPDVDDGQIAVVGVDDSVTLKVVYHIQHGLQLISLNPKYKPMIYNRDNTDYLAIIGLAVAYKRRL